MKKVLAFLGLVFFLGTQTGWAQVFTNTRVNPVSEDRKTLMGANLVAVHNDVIYILWTENMSESGTKSFLSRSTDGGITFANHAPISEGLYQVFTSMNVADNGTIHTSWTGFQEGLGIIGVRYAKSEDGGLSFGSEQEITPYGNFSVVKSYGNEVYVLFLEIELVEGIDNFREYPAGFYFRRSQNGGDSFGDALQLTPPESKLGDFVLEDPVAMSVTPDGVIYASWVMGRDGDEQYFVYVAQSDNGGVSFDQTSIVPHIPEFEAYEIRNVKIHAVADTVHVVLRVTGEGDDDDKSYILYARSTDAGLSFPHEVIIREQEFGSPALAVSEKGTIYISYYDYNGPDDFGTYVATSLDQGETFKHYLYISDVPSGVNGTQLFVENTSPEILHVVWLDERNTPNDDVDIRDIFHASNAVTLHEIEITGHAGWRMLGLPVHNSLVATLDRQNWIQGLGNASSGANDATPNFYFFGDHEGHGGEGPHPAWEYPHTTFWHIPSGKGFIWYLYESTTGMSQGFPFTLEAFGGTPKYSVTVPVQENVEFLLMANPFGHPLQVTNVDTWGDLQAQLPITWNPALNDGLGGWQEITTADPFTAFFVEQNLGASGTITIPYAAPTERTIVAEQSSYSEIQLKLSLYNAERDISIQDELTRVRFREGGQHGWDQFDTQKMWPLTDTYAQLYVLGHRGEQAVRMATDTRPAPFTGSRQIPVMLETSNISGDVIISAAMFDIPDDWIVALTIPDLGLYIDMRNENWQFTVQEDQISLPFYLYVDSGVPSSVEQEDEAQPATFTLHQNYPNPFNPVTLLRFELPVDGFVRLEIYDITGRKVSTLVQEVRMAGLHEVRFDASNLSSGMYMAVLTQMNYKKHIKMTVLK